MTELVNRYRLNAKKCAQLAANFKNLEAKRELLIMASAWLALAARREENIESAPANHPASLVNEPRPPPVEPPAPSPMDEPPKPPGE